MTRSRKAAAPTKTDENGRDNKGRFALGNPGGPGRPPRPDIYAIAEECATRHKFDLRERLGLVVRQLLAQAQGGDVQAAKLLLDRLTDSDPVKHEHSGRVTLDTLIGETIAANTKPAK